MKHGHDFDSGTFSDPASWNKRVMSVIRARIWNPLLMSVFPLAPEFATIMGGPALMFPTAAFESQEPIITREAADLLNKV
jgi:hypothetical protein